MNEQDNKRLGELIFELAQGKIDVLSDIYLLMYKILYAVGNIYLKQKADIEDEIQNLLILLNYKAHKFKKNKNACAWIVKLYKNLILNHLKKNKREDNFIAEEIEKLQISAIDDVFLENHLFVNDIFSRLSEYERELIIYRYWCKCSIKEVADILNRPKSTIESQLIKLENKIKKI